MSHFIVSLIRGKGTDSEDVGAVRTEDCPQGRVRTEDNAHRAESEHTTMSTGLSEQKTVSMGQSQKTMSIGQSQKTVSKGQNQKTVFKGQSQNTMPVDQND